MGIGLAVGMGVAVFAGISLILALHGGPGWLFAGSITLVLVAALVYWLVAVRGIRLVADERGVAVTDLFGGKAFCRGEDLAAIRWVTGYRTQVWSFVQRDGSVAFQTDTALWPRSAIEAIAQKFSVPLQLTQADQVPKYPCPVCGYPGLDEPPERDSIASHEICPSCGFEFGVTDGVLGKTYAAWREQWVQVGMPWWANQAGQDPPRGWDPASQLKSVRTS